MEFNEMTPEDKSLWKEAVKYVHANYPEDCPFTVQLVYYRFLELKK